MGNALKWFDKRRGLAAGLTAMGFGSGAAITVIPLIHSLVSHGYQRTFLVFGLIQGGLIFVAALALKKAPDSAQPGRISNPRLLRSKVDSPPKQTLSSAVFWIMYIDFTLVAATGLIATAELAPIAHSYHIAMLPVTLIGVTLPALTYALSINNIMNGLSRVVFGWVSDTIGREMTLFITFFAEGLGIFALAKYGRNPLWFVVLAGLVFFAWGNIFGIFPALTTDQYGKKYATTNYAMLYTAKGSAAFFVPLGSYLALRTGSWSVTLDALAIANIVAAVMMPLVVRPLRVREIRKQEAAAAQAGERVEQEKLAA
jgi:OFA family oxalate/formate antiporter-like MFS transporter